MSSSYISRPTPLDQLIDIYKTIDIDSKNRDIVFVCGGERLAFHRAVVLRYSAFLTNLSSGILNDEVIVTLDNVNPVIIRIIMNCIYSGQSERVPSDVLKEVETVLKMLGFNLLFSAEMLHGVDTKMISDKTSENTENAESNANFDINVKLKKSELKKEVYENMEEASIGSSNILSPSTLTVPDKSPTFENNKGLDNDDVSLTCSYCVKSTSFTSPARFLQHLSLSHFKKQLREKYKMSNFIPNQPCMYCQKMQKNVASYIVHIGALHNKVIQWLPKRYKALIQLKQTKKLTMLNARAQKIQSKYSNIFIKKEVMENDIIENKKNCDILGLKANLLPLLQPEIPSSDSDNKTSNKINIKQESLDQTSEQNSLILNEVSGKADSGPETTMKCTICEPSKEFPSRCRLLQHASLMHFRRNLYTKYLAKFVKGQKCDYCEKVQKGSQGYIVHLGALHEKVLEFVPIEIELQTMIIRQKKKSVKKNCNNKIENKMDNSSKIKNENKNSLDSELDQNNQNIETHKTSLNNIKMSLNDIKKLFTGEPDMSTNNTSDILTDVASNCNSIPPTSLPSSSTMRLSSSSTMTCALCKDSKAYSSRSRLLQHVTMAHFYKTLSQKYVNEFVSGQSCKFCEKIQKSKQTYIIHLGARHEKVFEFTPDEMQVMISNYEKGSSKSFDGNMSFKKIQCTLCESGTITFKSKCRFMLHLSSKHYCQEIKEKYIPNFKRHQPCGQCEKSQKNKVSYIIHIGVFHKKVFDFIPDNIKETLGNIKRNETGSDLV